MRILHLLPHLSRGGAERQFSYLAQEQIKLGQEVHVAYLYDDSPRPDLQNISLNQLKSSGNHDPYLLWQLIRLIRKINPDIVQTWITQMDILGGVAARITGVPWILREPSSAMAYPSSWKNGLRIFIGSSANAIISNSLCGKKYWQNKKLHCELQVIRNGLPLYDIDREVANLPLNITGQDCPIVLCVGRLESNFSGKKNLSLFMQVLASTKEKHNIFGIICGTGSKRNELEKLAHKLGIHENLVFTGVLSVKSIWALMKKAAVYVSLSSFEGCPNTVMEAMACGCPLVISDIPAHREILDESSAIFVDPSDIPQTTIAILDVLQNTVESKKRTLIARRIAESWTIKKMAAEYQKVYRRVLTK